MTEIVILDDPFEYPKQLTPEEVKRAKLAQYARNYRNKKRGGPPKQRGGKRVGAGRKKDPNTIPKPPRIRVYLYLTKYQKLLLLEYGNGTLSDGINQYLNKNI